MFLVANQFVVFVDILILVGLVIYGVGVFFLSQIFLDIGIYLLCLSLGLIGINWGSRIVYLAKKNIIYVSEAVEINRYLRLASLLSLLAFLSLTFFYMSLRRLIDGYTGWQMFNFFNF